MKKIIALLAAAGMLLSVCGCGMESAPGVTTEPSVYTAGPEEYTSEGETSTPPEETNEEPVTVPAPESEPVFLPSQPEPSAEEFVPVKDYIPDLMVELRYASVFNFTGQRIYQFEDAYLRYGTVQKLQTVQEALKVQGLGLKLWDGFRPVSAQYSLWQVCPDPQYVANPETGYSSHSRGNTVDITLVDAAGQELRMPTVFDDFSAYADRDYSDCPPEAAQNALLLQQVMEEAGFSGYFGEWWHFSDTDTYPVEFRFTPLEPQWRYISASEPVSLRLRSDASSEELLQLSDGEGFLVLARYEDSLLIYYRGLRGYIPEEFTVN